MIPLGLGFFHLVFSSDRELSLAGMISRFSLAPGMFRLSPWDPNFNPHSQKITHSQTWVRLHGLPWFFWDPKIIKDIVSCVGVPLRLDKRTIDCDIGAYPRVMIDFDMESVPPNSVSFEAGQQCFDI